MSEGEGVGQALGVIMCLAHPIAGMLDLPVHHFEIAVW
jgi:hypothetical protein